MKREMLLGSVVSLVVPLLAGGIANAAEPQDSKSLSKISSDFSTFAGSTANSTNLATGLRTGSPITLTSTDAKGVITETTFSPPTGKMGNGNVFISLALAKQNLANVGITQPTPEQIQAALTNGTGGTITLPNGSTQPLTGVLTYRSQGMGWGKIAQTYGYKLGPVISGMKSGHTQAGAPTPAPLPATAAAKASATGVTTASGTSASGVTTASGGSNSGHGNALGKGITTGAGGAAGQGNGNAFGRGITTGAGASPGQSGTASHGKGKGG